jgi:cytidine deaminase
LSEPTAAEIQALVDAAADARARAYAPYSGFAVGAAVLTEDGAVVPGANVENAAYPVGMCAERTAVGRAVSEGARRLRAVAVVGSQDPPTWPCGACRQVLHEFGSGLLVVAQGGSGERRQQLLSELLPAAFGPQDLP